MRGRWVVPKTITVWNLSLAHFLWMTLVAILGLSTFQIRSSKGLRNLSYLICHFPNIKCFVKIHSKLRNLTVFFSLSIRCLSLKYCYEFWVVFCFSICNIFLSFLVFHFHLLTDVTYSTALFLIGLLLVVLFFTRKNMFYTCSCLVFCFSIYFLFRSVKIVSLSFRFDARSCISFLYCLLCTLCHFLFFFFELKEESLNISLAVFNFKGRQKLFF